jgi:uncharacterized protein (UPF0276 family)
MRQQLGSHDVGIGLRLAHLPQMAAPDADDGPAMPWVEVHSETFLCDGGPRLALLDAVAARTPVSCHGVGLSLGSAAAPDHGHLARLRRLHDRIDPVLVSEHLAWSVVDGDYLNDLLPLPYTAASLDAVCRNVDQTQQALGRKIMMENPAGYLTFPATTIPETEFLDALVQRTGCALLLDVNNVYVTAGNLTRDAGEAARRAHAYIDALDPAAVGEIHLAGHSVVGDGAAQVLIDSHGSRVCTAVWDLYRYALARIGARPTVIEWDLDLPDLSVLLAEAACAQAVIDTAPKGARDVA